MSGPTRLDPPDFDPQISIRGGNAVSLDHASFAPSAAIVEDPRYLSEQLLTYIGNKRSLLPVIDAAAEQVQTRLGHRLVVLDAFSGSGAVSRLFKARAGRVIANDLESYARVMSECYLSNRADVDPDEIGSLVEIINTQVDQGLSVDGFIEELYAPDDDEHIRPGERVFYTRDNARRLDAYATLIHQLDERVKPYLLAPLLSLASVHANTSGVFKGFHKDRRTGIGRFGGSGRDALVRILRTIRLSPPVLSRHSAQRQVLQMDANALPGHVGPVDLAYLDPPYNQHPYGSNYFMLNLLVDYTRPKEISPISGIPVDWNRSRYNVRRDSATLLHDLVASLDARFLILSFNDEGYITPAEMVEMLASVGAVTEFRSRYNTFRGSRNLRARRTHVTEHLFVVEKG
ncbi:DNA modification methylase [Streptomyces sp. SID6673]|nr:DNA modification methylase [Streptomyces sp. SID11726]NEB26934.1 DNA modification methylase [Streptomyces sp. SID6673]